jgi:hypothetical protein
LTADECVRLEIEYEPPPGKASIPPTVDFGVGRSVNSSRSRPGFTESGITARWVAAYDTSISPAATQTLEYPRIALSGAGAV